MKNDFASVKFAMVEGFEIRGECSLCFDSQEFIRSWGQSVTKMRDLTQQVQLSFSSTIE